MKKIVFITGSSGFIGYHLALNFLRQNFKVVGLDAMTNYYDINLKISRENILKKYNNFYPYRGFVQNQQLLDEISDKHKPKIIIHLAAQAGVRYSVENPYSYVESNLLGAFHVLEMSRKCNPHHLLISSTSSVYGSEKKIPFTENQNTDRPLSFYAATKKSNEVMAHSYSYLFDIPTTIFRFFTVYGPWGRPDMALFKFTKNILEGKTIDIHNHGNMTRDFTYIDDLIKAISQVVNIIPKITSNNKLKEDSISNVAPYRIINIGSSNPLNLNDYVEQLELALGIKAKKNFIDIQEGELRDTFSDNSLLENLTGLTKRKALEEGIFEFVNWYKSYYKQT